MKERTSVDYAREYLEDAQKVVAAWEYIEKSRKENPSPKVLDDLRQQYDDIVNNNFKGSLQSHKESEFALRLRVDELLIRVVASSETPISPTLINKVWEQNLEGGLDSLTMHSEIWCLMERGVLEWSDGRKIKLTDEVREQFK